MFKRRGLVMTPKEILHEIVKMEHDARILYDEAVHKQDGFAACLEETGARLHDEYYKKADEEIAAFEAIEIDRANKEIAVLDSKFEADMEHARKIFESEKGMLIERIFDIVVGANA